MALHDLSFRDLLAVDAVATHSHFGRAAAALRIAQPTLSAQVQKVERLLGGALFERSGRSFLVTEEGRRLLPLIREAIAAAAKLNSHPPEGPGPLRLGVIPTLGAYYMPHLLMPLRRASPDVALQIVEQPTSRLLEMLHSGALDAALLSVPLRQQSLESIPLFDEPFHLIAARGSEIMAVERLVPSRLAACDMILLEDGHCLREQAIAVCSRRGGTSPRLVTTSLETLKYLVAAGGGYSLLPALACNLMPGLRELVQLRAFDDRPPSRRVGLCFRRTVARRNEVAAVGAVLRRNLPAGVHPVRV